MQLAIDPSGGVPAMAGERTHRADLRPARPLDRGGAARRGAGARLHGGGRAGVLATHLTETVREHMPELLSFAETQKLLDELPREHQKLVADVMPAQIERRRRAARAAGAARRARLHPRPADHPRRHPGSDGGGPARHVRHPRRRARAAGAAALGRGARAERLRAADHPLGRVGDGLRRGAGRPAGGAAARHGAVPLAGVHAAGARRASTRRRMPGESPALVCSGGIRGHVRAIVERFRPATTVLAQAEIHPRARIRTVGSV